MRYRLFAIAQSDKSSETSRNDSVILSGTKNLCVLEYADYQKLAEFYALQTLRYRSE
ncbi:MAG: hypothetical protein WCZ89_01470 [Phycisphaerae bacterium]